MSSNTFHEKRKIDALINFTQAISPISAGDFPDEEDYYRFTKEAKEVLTPYPKFLEKYNDLTDGPSMFDETITILKALKKEIS
jgi:hypothetical protein